MNVTFEVRTLFDCDDIDAYKQTHNDDFLWAQTVLGCRLLLVLKDMYRFNVTYMIPNILSFPKEELALTIYPHINDSLDIYATPMALTREISDVSYPIAAIFTRKFGFILKQPRSPILRRFYSLPFTKPVWNILHLMILVVSGVFFYLSRWEKKMLGGYSSYHYELLLAIGACCQHILPLQANMISRRIAYFSFIMSVYVLNCFYCSNLLSHLVSDKDSSMDLQTLANSDYECAKLKMYNVLTQNIYYVSVYKIPYDTKISIIQNKLSRAKSMNMIDGLNAVMYNKIALLTDYFVVYPILSRMFETEAVCQLVKVDLYSNIKKYFYTSKNFTYIDEFKIGILRAKETGVLQKILSDDVIIPLNCAHTYPMIAELEQIIVPLGILLGSYMVATIIMLLERWHHRRCRVWPYVE